MEMDILAILMVAFGLFAVLMFILFYAYIKKYYNEKHLVDDYHDDNDDVYDLVNILIGDKEYVFDANGYYLKLNEKVRVFMNNNTYDGIVTKENYKDSPNDKPEKLLIEEVTKEELPSNVLVNDIEDEKIDNIPLTVNEDLDNVDLKSIEKDIYDEFSKNLDKLEENNKEEINKKQEDVEKLTQDMEVEEFIPKKKNKKK